MWWGVRLKEGPQRKDADCPVPCEVCLNDCPPVPRKARGSGTEIQGVKRGNWEGGNAKMPFKRPVRGNTLQERRSSRLRPGLCSRKRGGGGKERRAGADPEARHTSTRSGRCPRSWPPLLATSRTQKFPNRSRLQGENGRTAQGRHGEYATGENLINILSTVGAILHRDEVGDSRYFSKSRHNCDP